MAYLVLKKDFCCFAVRQLDRRNWQRAETLRLKIILRFSEAQHQNSLKHLDLSPGLLTNKLNEFRTTGLLYLCLTFTLFSTACSLTDSNFHARFSNPNSRSTPFHTVYVTLKLMMS